MPYQVIAPDSVSVLKSNSIHKDQSGRVVNYDHTGEIHEHGAVLADSDVSPVVQQLYEDGDEHTRSVLLKLTDAEAEKAVEAAATPEEESAKPKRTAKAADKE